MYISGSTLRTSADFDNAMMFELDIIVWQDDKMIDHGGKVDKVTDKSIRINDVYYFISSCVFKVR